MAPTRSSSASRSTSSASAAESPLSSSHPQRLSERSIGKSGAVAQDTYAGGRLFIHRQYIRDAYGRTMLLRGVNLCANSKLPLHSPHANNPEHPAFFQSDRVSFVNRPFSLQDAHEHFARLKHWGLSFVRLLVPWEALEHTGPGIYDTDYIDYLKQLLCIMPRYGLKCFLDPHQDVWSRFSGGSGAPGWTFSVAGMDIRKFKVTGAACVHNTHGNDFCDCTVDPETGVYIPRIPSTEIDSTRAHLSTATIPGDKKLSLSGTPPPMLWPTNYTKLASSTMFTLFFAGEAFAPQRMVNGKNIQTFLQDCYLNCYRNLAEHVKDYEAVIGFEVINEPHQGYIGLNNLLGYNGTDTLLFGDAPSALQAFALGSGIPQEIDVYTKSWPLPTSKTSTRLVNSEQESVWLPDYTCPWRDAGVWDINPDTDLPIILKPEYFCKHPVIGRPVDFSQDFYLPFTNAYARAIHSVFPTAFVLVEPVPLEAPPVWHEHDANHNIIFAPHWYDLHSVFNKSFTGFITHDVPALRLSKNILAATYFGITGAKKNYTNQVKNIVTTGLKRVGEKPCVIGECGIPMDINEKRAFETGNFEHHSNFLDAVISAMESNLVHFTLWNYNPTNDNIHGDFWNGEDFSIYSPSPRKQYKDTQQRNVTKFHRSRSPTKQKKRQTIDKSTDKESSPSSKIKKVTSRPIMNSIDVVNMNNPESMRPSSPTSPTSVNSAARFGDSPMTALTPFDITELYFGEDTPDSSYLDRGDHHTGGRVLDAVIRPYASRVAGIPVSTRFDLATLSFQLVYKNASTTPLSTDSVVQLYRDAKTQEFFRAFDDAQGNNSVSDTTQNNIFVTIPVTSPMSNHIPSECFETTIYVPSYHYGTESVEVVVSDGDWEYLSQDQTLTWRHSNLMPDAVHTLTLKISLNSTRQIQKTTEVNINDKVADIPTPSMRGLSPIALAISLMVVFASLWHLLAPKSTVEV